MLKYLIILLDDSSTAYCHYEKGKRAPRLIALGDLVRAINFGMKENLMIQFIYPDYALPQQYEDLIDTIDHVAIKPAQQAAKDDIAVCDLPNLSAKTPSDNVIVRTDIATLTEMKDRIADFIFEKDRVNLTLTDIGRWTQADIDKYAKILDFFVAAIVQRSKSGARLPQLNILTDRLMLTEMNNCNAGVESITVAPDGKFYVCPAFYYAAKNACGSLAEGLDIKNRQLYRLDHAPICRKCDAWHCHRCVWLNSEKTLEVNTPSHVQCVVSHLERNASRKLLAGVREFGEFMPGTEIYEITYLDPFEKIE